MQTINVQVIRTPVFSVSVIGGGGAGTPGLGTVTSVALALPSDVFNVSGSPITSAGTLTATFDTQTANTVFSGPTTGSAATPAFRALVAADIPTLPQSSITDLVTDLAGKQPLDSDLTAIAGLSPSNDDFIQRKTGAWTNRSIAQVKTDLGLTGTNTGDQTITLTGDVTGTGTGSFAATIANDAVTFAKMQNIGTAKLLGRFSASTGDVEEITISTGLSLDGSGNLTATSGGGGTVTSVALTMPTAIFDVAGSPITGSGTLAVTLDTQTANTVFSGPTTGAADTPTFRALVSDDIPTLPQSKITDLTTDLAGKQPLDSDLTAIAGLSPSNDDFIQRKTGAWTNRSVAQVKTDLGLTGTNTGDQTITLTGDVTGTGTGSFAATIAANAVTFAKMQAVSANILLGNDATGTAVEEIACTAAGRDLLDDADATAQRTTLGLGTLATQNGTFSGTSSGTNTGDQTITLTGDVTGSGTGTFAATIATRSVGVLVSDPTGDAITTGDGKAYVRAFTGINGMNLTAVAASVSTVSSSGAVTVQIRRVRSGSPVDMLSTALTIDASETDSSTAATAAVINTSNDDIATADQIFIDIDGSGTGAKGLFISLTFTTP